MSINLTDELLAKTKKGKIASAKQVFLEGDQENLQQIGDKTHQLEDAIKDITVSGGASTANAVSYNNETSGMTAVTAQGAIDELAAKNATKAEKTEVTSEFEKKFDKESILQESGDAEDKVMSQKAVSDKLSDLLPTFVDNNIYYSGKVLNGFNEIENLNWGISDYIPIKVTDGLEICYGGNGNESTLPNIVFYDSSKKALDGITYKKESNIFKVTVSVENTNYVRIPFYLYSKASAYCKINDKIVWFPLREATNNNHDNYIRKGCISYLEKYKKRLNCVVDFNLYIPNDFVGKKLCLTILGYSEVYKKVYVGFKDLESDALYYGATDAFEKESGICKYGVIFSNTNKFIYADICIDWSLYSAESFLDDNAGKGTFSDIILIYKSTNELSRFSGSKVKLNNYVDFYDIHIFGSDDVIEVAEAGKINVVNNVSIKNVTFAYTGSDALLEREVTENSERLKPIITEEDFSNDNITYDNIFIKINLESKECEISGCVFKNFHRTVIATYASGRHKTSDHSVVSNNMFLRCYIGVFEQEEFLVLKSNRFIACPIGVICYSSNINLIDNKFARCDAGAYFKPGNDAYGIINDCVFVHCNVASLYAQTTPKNVGVSVNSCFIFDAPIICKEAYALSVANCMLDTNFVINKGNKNRIVSNTIRYTYAKVANKQLFDVPDDTIIKYNRAAIITDNDESFNKNENKSFVALDCIGDSMTYGGEWNILQSLINVPIVNQGVGGENAATILGRVNCINYLVKEDITIPADTSPIQIKLTNEFSQLVLPCLQELSGIGRTLEVMIAGIEGTLSTTQSDVSASSADYYFSRKVSGSEILVKAKTPILVLTNSETNAIGRNKILWIGQNGGFKKGDETNRYAGDIQDKEQIGFLIQMIDTFVKLHSDSKIIIITPSEATSDLLESMFKEKFGSKCFVLRQFMVDNGIRIAKEFGGLDDTHPNADDLSDINNHIVPRCLRKDSIHYNTAGNIALAHGLYNLMKATWGI